MMTPLAPALLMPGGSLWEALILAAAGLLTLAGVVFWIWMLADCLRHEEASRRAGWAILIAVLHVVGALAYFFGHRRSRLAEAR